MSLTATSASAPAPLSRADTRVPAVRACALAAAVVVEPLTISRTLVGPGQTAAPFMVLDIE